MKIIDDVIKEFGWERDDVICARILEVLENDELPRHEAASLVLEFLRRIHMRLNLLEVWL